MQASREQVLAYRVAAQQLDRSAKTVRSLAVLDIGVQDAAGEAARLAFDGGPHLPGAYRAGVGDGQRRGGQRRRLLYLPGGD